MTFLSCGVLFDDAGVANPLVVVEDGQAAIDYLSGADKYADREKYPLPAVVFLDLKLPLKSGFDVLSWMRKAEPCANIVVIVLTSSDESTDIKKSYDLGANSFLTNLPLLSSWLILPRHSNGTGSNITISFPGVVDGHCEKPDRLRGSDLCNHGDPEGKTRMD